MKEGPRVQVSRRALLRSACIPPVISIVHARAAKTFAKPDDPSFTISSTVNRVELDVSVKTREGAYVSDLRRENFQVFENGRLQPIITFSSVDKSVTVGLVVDDSGSMRDKRPAVVTAGLAFAKESNQQDQFFVVNFNNYVAPGLPQGVEFSDNLQLLRSALYMGDPAGQTALYDAILFGLKHLRKGLQAKKTLIVVSDGGDNVSKASAAEVLAAIKASQATIYTVGLFSEDDPDRNPAILEKMSRLSGGEYFNPPSLADVIPVFHTIAMDIRHRYTITYAPDPALDPDKVPDRLIRVTAQSPAHKKLIAHTRTSYSFKPSPNAPEPN